jgi:predicted  nucleic acid-binding Zn-ribbon protein
MESLGLEASVFGVGVGMGLLIALYSWISQRSARAALKQEIEDLKKHLHLQMSINTKGYEELKQELDRLKKENENLRITVGNLSNKPGRAELKTLYTWDKAIRSMSLKSPVFAPAWEMAVAEAQKEMEDVDSGMKALVRKVFSMLPETAQHSGEGTIGVDN